MELYVEEAETYEKCLEKIKEAHGPHIRITRQENKKKRSFFWSREKDVVRLIFTIDKAPYEKTDNNFNKSEPLKHSEQPINIKTKPAFIPPNEEEARLDILKKATAKSEKLKDKIEPYMNSLNSKENTDNNIIQQEEFKNLAKTVERLAEQISKNGLVFDEPENIVKISEILKENDFTEKYICLIKEKIKQNLSISELEDFGIVQKKVLHWIADSIKIKVSEFSPSIKGKIISLVGPTGIGKTTTISKLAAYYVVEGSSKADRLLNVQLITIDQYRIGATYQIKKYCELMKLPLSIAENPSDLHKYLELYKDAADIICMDTTGRSPGDYAKIIEMQKYFRVIDKDLAETHLVVSAVAKSGDIKEIIKQYSGFEYDRLIITKLDETTSVGSLISVLSEFEIPISFVTTGQVVPKDLQIASKKLFIKRLKGFTIDIDYIDKEFDDEILISWERRFW